MNVINNDCFQVLKVSDIVVLNFEGSVVLDGSTYEVLYQVICNRKDYSQYNCVGLIHQSFSISILLIRDVNSNKYQLERDNSLYVTLPYSFAAYFRKNITVPLPSFVCQV